MHSLNELWRACQKRGTTLSREGGPSLVIGLDPGHTTGVAILRIKPDKAPQLHSFSELNTKELPQGAALLHNFLQLAAFDTAKEYTDTDTDTDLIWVFVENYRVYAKFVNQHTWAELHTPKLIGAIQLSCHLLKLPLRLQMAHEAKSFFTNDKLQSWGIFPPAQKRHAADALRHALHGALFNGQA